MKKTLIVMLLLVCCWIPTSCDDGDIILTEFEFDEQDLQLCNGAQENDFVFFKINTALQEAISFDFNSELYDEMEATTTPIEINLEGSESAVIYRKFSSEITADYYCNTLPPNGITVTEELRSVSGIARITNTIENEDDNDGVDAITESNGIDPQADPDNDGVLNYLDDNRNDATIGDDNNSIEDGFDTDGDGIPNFKDQDDDNDSILTSAELSNGDPDNDAFRDTDEDGIPDYLDPDDDNDGVPTVEEGSEPDDDLRDDDEDGDGVANYLQADSQGRFEAAAQLGNTVQTTFVTRVTVTELQFGEDNQNFLDSSFSFGARETTTSITTDPPEDTSLLIPALIPILTP